MQLTRPLNAVLIAGLVIVLGCSREAATTASNSTVPFVESSTTAANVTDKTSSVVGDVEPSSPPSSSEASLNTSLSTPEPALIEPITPHEFEVVGPEDAVRVTFADLNLKRLVPDAKSEKEAAEKVPQWIMALNGRRIRIRGFMFPTFAAEGLTGFTLGRDISASLFHPNPPISELIDVALRDGITTDYIENRAFDVVGVLKIGAEVAPGRFYQLSDAILIDEKIKTRASRSD